MTLITMNEILARTMCVCVGISPIDPIDGSPNWWMFHDEAQKLINDLKVRFPPLEKEYFGPEYGPFEK